MNVMVILIFFLRIIIYFTFLFIYHLFSNHSKKVMNWTQRLNYLNMIIIIWDFIISFIYFGFYCDRQLRTHYINIVIAAVLIFIIYVFQPEFRYSNGRFTRIFTYFTFGFTTFLPAIHFLIFIDE
jgi:adiponectin receptor